MRGENGRSLIRALDTQKLLDCWLEQIAAARASGSPMPSPAEATRHLRRLVSGIVEALEDSDFDSALAAGPLRTALEEVAAALAALGLGPGDAMRFILALKEAVYEVAEAPGDLATRILAHREVDDLVDRVALVIADVYVRDREKLVLAQADTIRDLASPVIQVWEGILALPLVGSIDSVRGREIMESLLHAVVEHEASIVILDITGVAVLDSQVASRLLRTVEAVRLLGATAVLTGINPSIAQTIVQLGIDLGHVVTRATLRAGLDYAFRLRNLKVVPREGGLGVV